MYLSWGLIVFVGVVMFLLDVVYTAVFVMCVLAVFFYVVVVFPLPQLDGRKGKQNLSETLRTFVVYTNTRTHMYT